MLSLQIPICDTTVYVIIMTEFTDMYSQIAGFMGIIRIIDMITHIIFD